MKAKKEKSKEQRNLFSGNIASRSPKALGESAHHHIHISWVHIKQLGHAAPRWSHCSDAVSLIQVQICFILLLQRNDLR